MCKSFPYKHVFCTVLTEHPYTDFCGIGAELARFGCEDLGDTPDDVRARLIDGLDRRLDFGASSRLEIEPALHRIGAEIRRLHGFVKSAAQDSDGRVGNTL